MLYFRIISLLGFEIFIELSQYLMYNVHDVLCMCVVLFQSNGGCSSLLVYFITKITFFLSVEAFKITLQCSSVEEHPFYEISMR